MKDRCWIQLFSQDTKVVYVLQIVTPTNMTLFQVSQINFRLLFHSSVFFPQHTLYTLCRPALLVYKSKFNTNTVWRILFMFFSLMCTTWRLNKLKAKFCQNCGVFRLCSRRKIRTAKEWAFFQQKSFTLANKVSQKKKYMYTSRYKKMIESRYILLTVSLCESDRLFLVGKLRLFTCASSLQVNISLFP